MPCLVNLVPDRDPMIGLRLGDVQIEEYFGRQPKTGGPSRRGRRSGGGW
jgi:hypothetical protein